MSRIISGPLTKANSWVKYVNEPKRRRADLHSGEGPVSSLLMCHAFAFLLRLKGVIKTLTPCMSWTLRIGINNEVIVLIRVMHFRQASELAAGLTPVPFQDAFGILLAQLILPACVGKRTPIQTSRASRFLLGKIKHSLNVQHSLACRIIPSMANLHKNADS